MSVKIRFSEVIIEVVEKYGLSNARVGRQVGFQTNVIDEHRRGVRKNPDVELIREFCNKYNVNPNWVLLGNGDKYINKGEAPEPAPIYKAGAPPDDDPRMIDLLAKTKETLMSGTGYSDSLAVSIRSFYNAAKTERRLDEIERETSELKKQVDEFARCEKDCRIRDYDPPEKKEEFIKMRDSA